MGIGADVRVFRYSLISQIGPSQARRCFVRVDEFTTTLVLAGVANSEPSALGLNVTFNLFLPPSTRSGSVNGSARSVEVLFTGQRPPGLVSPRKTLVVLNTGVWNSYVVGQTGTFRGFPVELTRKIDGSPSATGL